MSKNAPKTSVVAFKVEEELAQFLDQLPNKSEFIRQAVYSQLGVACPLCHATGRVAKETHDEFVRFLAHWQVQNCDECGEAVPVPKDSHSESHSVEHGHVRHVCANEGSENEVSTK